MSYQAFNFEPFAAENQPADDGMDPRRGARVEYPAPGPIAPLGEGGSAAVVKGGGA